MVKSDDYATIGEFGSAMAAEGVGGGGGSYAIVIMVFMTVAEEEGPYIKSSVLSHHPLNPNSHSLYHT